MLKLYFIIAFMMVVYSAEAQDCDCTIVPFTPEKCFDECSAQLLKAATSAELELIVGLPNEIAAAVVQQKPTLGKDLNNLREVLSNYEFYELTKQLKSLNSTQIEYFNKDLQDRRKINREMRKLEINLH